MARYNRVRASFAYGLVSARMLGRFDLRAVYTQALRECVNWLPDRTGSLRYRAGTQYSATLGDEAPRRLAAFEVDRAPAVLELRETEAVIHYTDTPSTDDSVFDLFDRESNIETVAGLTATVIRECQIVFEPFASEQAGTQVIYVVHPSISAIKLLWGSNNLTVTAVDAEVFNSPPQVGASVAAAAFFEQRLVVGGSNAKPQSITGSRTPDPMTGNPRYTEWTLAATISSILTVFATHGFTYTLAASNLLPRIRWMVPFGEALFIGTDRTLYLARELAPDTTPLIRLHATIGASWVQPVVTPFGVLFVAANRKRIYEAYSKRDITAFVDDLFESDLIKELAWQQNPVQRLWVLTDSGQVRVYTVAPEGGVMAWGKISFGSGVTVKSIATTYGNEEGSALWLAIQRGTQDFLEGMVDPTDHRHDRRCYLDSSVVRTTDAAGEASMIHLSGDVTVQEIDSGTAGADERQATTFDQAVIQP